MIKRFLMLAQLLLAAFLVKFLDADSDSGGSDSDSGDSDSDSGGSDSGGSNSDSDGGSSDGLSSSLETMEWSGSDSGDSTSQSSQRKKPIPRPEDLLSNLSAQDLSQIPRRDDFPGPPGPQ